MTSPLVVLAGVTCFVGLLGFAPLGAPFMDWVYFGAAPETPVFSPLVALLSVIAVGVGIVVGYRIYRDWREPDPIVRLGRFTTILEHKYYLDDFYWDRIVRPVRDPIAAGVYWFDQHILDGVVNGAAWVTHGGVPVYLVVRPHGDRRRGQRRGLLDAAVRERTADHPDRAHPVVRGRFVRRRDRAGHLLRQGVNRRARER